MLTLIVIPLMTLMFKAILADYDCLCNYNIDLKIYAAPDVQSNIVGRMYEFDCKPSLSSVKNTSGFMAVQFEKQVGYLQPNDQVQKQICSGQPSPDDLVSTTPASTITTASASSSMTTTKVKSFTSTIRQTSVFRTTTSMPIKTTTRMTLKTTTTAPKQTTTRVPIKTTTKSMSTEKITTMKTTRRFTTTTQSTMQPTTEHTTPSIVPVTSSTMKTTPISTDNPSSAVVKDRIEVCPDHVKTDVAQKGGFLGQYGDFCLEVVDWMRPFDGAESHCRITSGHLVAITNQDEQDYVTGLLAKHNYVNSSWIGLNDKSGEGTYRWTSGATFSYNNMKGDFNQHSSNDHNLNDCFVIKQGGEWTDLPCGVSLTFLGLGEQHPFICQYNVSAKVQSLFEIIPQVIG